MLHRLALRVLPSLSIAVTEDSIRKRKRLMMLVPGFVAFGIYRLAKQVVPLGEPLVLLLLSGLVSLGTALWAYGVGRVQSVKQTLQDESSSFLGWLLGWIGFVYGVQLSLLVLALLKIVVNYDFLQHPDGPAMMAIIISCTAVARDAFEIGHIRRLQAEGKPVVTFPNGESFRALLGARGWSLATWVAPGTLAGLLLAIGVQGLWTGSYADLVQLMVVSLVAGSVAVWTYLAGKQGQAGWQVNWQEQGWWALFQFWWWPGLAFAATYYFAFVGAAVFVFRLDPLAPMVQGAIAASVAGLMALYGYYLGVRRAEEDRVGQVLPVGVLRCPFVMGILSKNGIVPAAMGPADVVLSDARRKA
jgi:hypothetical protein